MNSNETTSEGQYQVVALRYRPQSFGDLVGQSHIATALSNAINKNRVGHAYLFTGARGVGKTSSARIFAKCLNCEQGPTMTPCNECDICQSVSAGEDVDVLEIDGASNRGIDEIRQLRSNAAVRPGRSKYKIYIIDEVHMLTTQAFNALLKTLEEPPAHVKFIFCTTDPQKIPITVLSRCQRFDFSPVQTNEIADRLREIAKNEGVDADEQSLALLARRANGSMRDSQSLLEQLFSFCGKEITVDEVHQLLGTADMGRIAEIATAMTNKDSAQTLNLIHAGVLQGVDSGQMASQLLGYFRDLMAVRVGCGEDTLLNCTGGDVEHLKTLADSLGLETILSIVQLLDAAVVRMQSSLHARTLLEAAAIRVCNLENLEAISDLVSSLSKTGGGPVKSGPAPSGRPRVKMRQVESPSKKNAVANPATTPPSSVSQNSTAADQTDGPADNPAADNSQAPNHNSQAPDDNQAVPAGSVPANAQPAASAAASMGASGAAAGVVASAAVAVASATATVSKADSSLSPTAKSEVQESAESESKASPESSSLQPADHSNTESLTADNSVSKAKVNAQNIEKVWKEVVAQMTPITGGYAVDYESLVLAQPDHLNVTLNQKFNSDMCSRPEKKKKFEAALESLAGTPIRIDFHTSKKSLDQQKIAPRMTRQQQIRKLHDDGFVKKTISLFDAEITGYQEPARTRKL